MKSIKKYEIYKKIYLYRLLNIYPEITNLNHILCNIEVPQNTLLTVVEHPKEWQEALVVVHTLAEYHLRCNLACHSLHDRAIHNHLTLLLITALAVAQELELQGEARGLLLERELLELVGAVLLGDEEGEEGEERADR